jgi:hypothetical protein
MKKALFFLIIIVALGSLVSCTVFREGDTIVALDGADDLYRNLSDWNWRAANNVCTPYEGERFVIRSISGYDKGEFRQTTMKLESLDRPGCWGWTTPGDADWNIVSSP